MVSRGHIDTPLNVRVETCHPKHVCNVFFFFLAPRLQLLASLVFCPSRAFRGPACPATQAALPRRRLSASRTGGTCCASGIGRCRTHVVPKARRPGSLTSGPCISRCAVHVDVLWGRANDPSWPRGRGDATHGLRLNKSHALNVGKEPGCRMDVVYAIKFNVVNKYVEVVTGACAPVLRMIQSDGTVPNIGSHSS